jgi:hypothetical protein
MEMRESEMTHCGQKGRESEIRDEESEARLEWNSLGKLLTSLFCSQIN